MNIELGGKVYAADGRECGSVREVLVETDGQRLDSVIVHMVRLGYEVIVPAKNIQRTVAGGGVHLTLTEEQASTLPTQVSGTFTASESVERENWDYMTAGGGQLAMPVGVEGSDSFIGMSNTNYENITEQSDVPDEEYVLRKGTHVLSADGRQVGTLHEIETADDRTLTGMVFVSGHIRTHVHRVALDQVQSANADEVRLHLTAADLAAAEQQSPTTGPA